MLVDFGNGDYTGRLKERMLGRDVTAAQLARASGIAASQLARWFNTEMQPSVENIVLLEQAMASLPRPRRRKVRGASE